MKKSEKVLALGVGAVLLLGLIFYGTIDFLDQYDNNASRMKSLKKQIQDEQNKMQFAIAASDRQGLFYEKVSFPTGTNQITAYQDWLEKTIRNSGLNPGSIGSPKVSPLAFKSDRNTQFPVGKKYNITVVSTGTLNDIIEFCHRFESLDVLQRIRDITLQPLNKKNSNSGQVKATFKIELLAVKNADENRNYQSAYRELPNTLEKYKQDIIARNIFGPANNPPSIRVANKTVEEEEDISVSLTGSDKDKDDELTFEIVDDGGIKGAKITASGRTRAKFVADPMPIGEYVALVKVTDSGFPQKSMEKEFKVVVEKKEEPTVAPVQTVEKPPVVLESPYTQICRFNSRIDMESQTEVFTVKIRNRMRGEIHELQVDDEFELDDKTWTVKDIQKLRLTIEVDGQLLEYRFGDFLDKPRNEARINENASEADDDATVEEVDELVETTTS